MGNKTRQQQKEETKRRNNERKGKESLLKQAIREILQKGS